MNKHLIDIPTGELLKKFGAGSHKPGSGSAAALQGMLSAQLMRTVISLTNDEKRRPHYEEKLPILLGIDSEIVSSLYPALEELFQRDSDQFDKVIKLRQAREEAGGLTEKKRLDENALRELKPATELPLDIANLCVKLANYSFVVFDHGFKSARGDSGVAITAAIAAISGCLSIIDLNLLSLESDEWAESIRSGIESLRSTQEELSVKAAERLETLYSLSRMKHSLSLELKETLAVAKSNKNPSNNDIEAIARRLQLSIWNHRQIVWNNKVPEHPMDVLNPESVFRMLQFLIDRQPTLGWHEVNGRSIEVAGQIDQRHKLVSISEQFPKETQNFTAAHELGHALMHSQTVLHRDKPLDGSQLVEPRRREELQADKFATYFLMPKKQVIGLFKKLFLTEMFIVNDATAFALNEKSPEALKSRCANRRGLARLLASVELYDGNHFRSIAKQFRVSIEAMAIRLEELNLLEY